MSESTSGRTCPDRAAAGPDDLIDRLESLWRQGQRPDVDAFLSGVGGLSAAQRATLLRVDQRQRWQHGERIPVEEYLRRHPLLRSEPDAAVDLVYGEFLLRERLGERPDEAD